MDIKIEDTDELYKEINESGLSLKELISLGLKSNKIIKTKYIEEKNSSNLVVLNELQKIQSILGISSKKGGISENIIMENICKYFPNAEVIPINSETGKGDILVKINNLNIMIEVKNYKLNTPTKEVEKFHRDLINNEYDASILLSINSGITGYLNKFNYDMIGNKFAIYLSNAGNDCLSVSYAILFILASYKLTKKIINENKNNKCLIMPFIENKLKLLESCIDDTNNINNSLHKLKIDLNRSIELSTNHIITNLNLSKNKINDIIKSFITFIDSEQINNDLSLLYNSNKKEYINDINNFNLTELRNKAKELNLNKFSKLNKSDLLKLIKNNI